MAEASEKTRPISFRVETAILDALDKAGLSPVEIARAALAREARRSRQRAALESIRKNPAKLGLGMDVVEFLRKDRESH